MQHKKKSATRRGNHEGSIYQRKDGLWISQISIGLKQDGKPLRKTFTGATRAEVSTKLIPYMNKENGKIVTAREEVRIESHMMFWLMNYKVTTVSGRTFESCIRNAKLHIFPVYGNYRPQDLNIDNLQPHFKMLLDKYELDTVKKIKYLFSEYLEYCLDRGLIDSNPLDRIKFKSMERKAKENTEKKEQKALPEELREPFLVALNTDRFFKAFCLTAMFAGLRPGEVIGLRWRDIDFNKETLSVMRGMTVEPEFDKEGNVIARKTVIGKTKTAGSVRTNPMPKLLVQALSEWKYYRTEMQAGTGFSLIEADDFVFGTNKGELRSYSGTKHMFDRFLKKNNLHKKGIHFYELRHTFSNTLFEQNTNPRVVQALMGHRKIETTMIYNTVRDNKYLESAIGIFDSRYDTALQAVDEPKHKYHGSSKNNADIQYKQLDEKMGQADKMLMMEKVSDFMSQNNISDLEELFSVIKKKSEMEM
ncbi:MAG: tyrosine-type recombinase/integrase [Clostridia bacterium]|nr:tyrosine-type recombinase/integrase [Clostridia bacterium]